MSNIKVWGRLTSANVQKAIWALEELALPYEHENRGGRFGGLDDPTYVAMNPNGLIPTLRDGDLILWESHAIVRYLTGRYAEGTLFPGNATERAIVDQWTDWTATRFQPAWLGVFWLTYRTKPENQKPDAIAAALAEARKAFAILDQRLGDAPFLGGEHLTYADIVAGIALYRWYEIDIERPDLPAITAWYARLRERAAFRKAVMVPFDELKGTF
jgi:glutathione S-transferase